MWWNIGAWVTGILILAAVLVGGLERYAGHPGLCVSCHGNQALWTAWQASVHRTAPCAACHGETVLNLYRHAWSGNPDQLLPQTGGNNAVCLGCHSTGRRSSTQADLQIPHEKYMASGRPLCVHCHSDVAHPAAGLAAGHPRGSSLPMSECVACHRQKQARIDCMACHEKPVQPLSHRRPGWEMAHGGRGAAPAEVCLECHRLLSREKPAAEGGLAAIRLTGFCQDCHRRKPPGHDGAWQLGHQRAVASGSQGCDVCHGAVPGAGRNTGAIACAACHGSRHGPGWDRAHPAAIRSSGMAPCFRCHEVAGCTACHVRQNLVPATRR